MLSASEARDLMPSTDPAEFLRQIEALVREAAAAGKTKIEIHRVLPQPEAAAWCMGRNTPVTTPLTKVLREMGYVIQRDSGGHHGPGYVQISWVL